MNQENLLDADNPDGYIAAAFATDDPSSIARALGEVARTRNMSKLAKDVGMNRSALYRALSGEGNPEFATILKVVKALGLKLTPVPAAR
ncbi:MULTISPECIES: addiction module antidote protein [unclassified Rhizobium]|uniref:addiction module antidote protein n=1 Tax=unclassified Rhizobium TaxID=2613769 RepID=UPI000EA9B3ED|nr:MULTISPECIES: addiction module antidote protein [unclassified Rhizobium]AYG66364.1 putative addiction module antidote protein [Rhizobium sp. CCGE531]AYG72745.1 putative addiction module antidote protein [Rhizobium sp. CCGE532]